MAELSAAVLDTIPEPLREGTHRLWDAFAESMKDKAMDDQGAVPDWDDAFLTELAKVWTGSEFVARNCIRRPEMLLGLVESGDLLREFDPGDCRIRLEAMLNGVSDEADLSIRLRRFRQLEMTRIAWRDLARLAHLDEVLFALSELAEACVDGALKRLHGWQMEEWGVPKDSAGKVQNLVVLGMGKLGAQELNFSSDIDLIFAFAEDGQINGPRNKTISEYFLRLGRRLIKAIDEFTAEGFVFRVDMRLRPFGDAGPLVLSFDAMEHYYTAQGREWERYAMMKARPIAGDIEGGDSAGAELMRMLKPFVYRRYLDYGTFEHLREMKGMIARQVVSKGMQGNIKLGPGGIREVEFIGQAFQMVRGGTEPVLQQRPIQVILNELDKLNLITSEAHVALRNAYRFLRDAENRLQAWMDQQTQLLPTDELNKLRLAFTMGYPDWAAFEADLQGHLKRVQGHFLALFGEAESEEDGDNGFVGLWLDELDERVQCEVLEESGFEQPGEVLRLLAELRHGRAYRSLTTVGRERMDRLMPMLLQTLSHHPDAHKTLSRLVTLLEAIAGRSVYLSLLTENPKVMEHLIRLMSASPWIAQYVTQHPLLLDELLDQRRLYKPTERDALMRSLEHRLSAVEEGDMEAEMIAMRQFKQTNLLHVAAADVVGVTPLMKVSDYLTDIAELLMQCALNFARRDMLKRYGAPSCTQEGVQWEPGMCVIGYGKMGGIELGYGSDLDVVFLHDSAGDKQYTDGTRSIDNNTFFARVGQRIVHLMSTPTAAGTLYEVDMRLRPDGASGQMVTSIHGFAEYQRNKAWTWEHQALVRARFVAGDARMKSAFEAIRHEILTRERDSEALKKEVREMRSKMREHLGSSKPGQFNLKQDAGGIADIEFLVQYSVLNWAHNHPALTRWTDNVRILDTLRDEGLMSEADATLLADAYRAFRARNHELVLLEKSASVPDTEFAELRDGVQRIWQDWMGGQ